MAPGHSYNNGAAEKGGGQRGHSSWSNNLEWGHSGAGKGKSSSKGAGKDGKGKSRGGKGGGKDGSEAMGSRRERPQSEASSAPTTPQKLVEPPPPPSPPSSDIPTPPPAATSSSAELSDVAQTRAKDEIFAEIRKMLENSPALQQADFDFRVRQHLHALYGSGGKGRLREAMAMLQAATMQKERQAVKKWPAYLLTLLKKFDSDQATQDREARARARVEAAAAGADPTSAKGSALFQTPPPTAAESDPFNFDAPMSEPWATWGLPQTQSPVAAR